MSKCLSIYPLAYLLMTLVITGCDSSSGDDTSTNDTANGNSVITTPETNTIVINEIVAKATNGGSDWIELYVISGTVDLSSYALTDDDESRTPQALPAITLSAGEYLVVKAIDEEDAASESDYYVTFKLGADDAVTLFQNNVAVDVLDWQDGDAAEGFSFGLLPDGTSVAETLNPTPGAANTDANKGSTEPEETRDTVTNNNAELRINEIVAASANGNDWIELYVSADSSITLSDYTVADDSSALLSLPNIILNPGEYYQISASKNSTTSDVLAFGIGSDDSISLFKGDDLIDSLSWSNGQALIHYSFGRYPDGSDALSTLIPTPAAMNQSATAKQLVINEVVANDELGGTDWLELYNNDDKAVNLAGYTLSDSNNEPASLPDLSLAPGEYALIYASESDPGGSFVPFKLGNEDELKLELNGDTIDYLGWQQSDVPAGFSYGRTSDGSWDLNTLELTPGTSNQEVIVFDTSRVQSLNIDIDREDWQNILANALDEEYHKASVSFNGVTLEEIAIRTKGNSSLLAVNQMGSERYSFKVDLNEYVSGQKLLGLKKFTLHNAYNDPSYLREYIAYQLMEYMGVPAPKNSFVNLYINNQLHGLYLMVEAIDGEFLEDNFANAEGDMYKPDGVGSDLKWISNSFDDYVGVDLKTNEDTSDNGAFLNFMEQLNNDAESVVDVDNILRYLSVSVALSNLDSYHGALAHNYYLYEQNGIFSILPWDFNEAFGTFNMGCQDDIRDLYIDEPTSGALSERPLVAGVLASQSDLNTYHGYLLTLIEGPLQSDSFKTRVEAIAGVIRDHVYADPTAFYGSSAFETNLNSDYERFYGLTSFINYRTNSMAQQLSGAIASSGDGSGYCGDVGLGGGPGGPPR